jgi:hypothetical protein
MKRYPAVLLTTSRAVFHVAFYGMADGSELRPDLVERAPLWNHLQQGKPIAHGLGLEVKHRFSPTTGLFGQARFALAGVAFQIMSAFTFRRG